VTLRRARTCPIEPWAMFAKTALPKFFAALNGGICYTIATNGKVTVVVVNIDIIVAAAEPGPTLILIDSINPIPAVSTIWLFGSS